MPFPHAHLMVMSIAVLVAASATRVSAGPPDYGSFRTPSGWIGCSYDRAFLRCDVDGGVRPLPPAPRDCQLDWGQGFEIGARGAAHVVCAGDTALNPQAPVVRYGTTVRHGPFTCSSSTRGLRCTNAAGRGFFLSKGNAYRF